MAVGYQGSAQSIGDTLGSMSVEERDWADRVLNKQHEYNKIGSAGLQAPPYSMSAADAQQVLDDINHLATVAQLWRGLVARPSPFNFEDSTTHTWGNR